MPKIFATNINNALLLNDRHFCDAKYNIDNVVIEACGENDPRKQYALLTHAADECDKFHGYFHFEESFFHFLMGQEYCKHKMDEHAIEKYKHAIAAHPLNKAAHSGLMQLYKIHGMKQDLENATSCVNSFCVKVNKKDQCMRPFSNFVDYIVFATNNKSIKELEHVTEKNNFWLSFEEFRACREIFFLKEAIDQVQNCRAEYRDNAAVIYYNCALVCQELGDIDLAKNAMTKSKSLNPKLDLYIS